MEEIGHADPIDSAREQRSDDRRIEVANVIGGENKPTLPWDLMIVDHANPRLHSKEQPHGPAAELPQRFAPDAIDKIHDFS
jgi:hypothetical protein